ncbi:MAG: twin-arginine translocation signal domain-containing protein, partial [Verrucomicrobiota bacterium]
MNTHKSQKLIPGPTRRQFIKLGAFGVASLAAGGAPQLQAAPLSSGVTLLCRRLASLGWRDLLRDVTGGQLDLAADDLERQLLAPLRKIDRTHPGFGDFSLAGTKAVEPGIPDRSLLYHALAAPTVVANRRGEKLKGFPTLAEIETLENFIYGSRKATLEDLAGPSKPEDLAVVVFALHYRSTPMSVT